MRVKVRLRNPVPDRRMQLNATHDLELDSIAIKNIIGTLGKSE